MYILYRPTESVTITNPLIILVSVSDGTRNVTNHEKEMIKTICNACQRYDLVYLDINDKFSMIDEVKVDSLEDIKCKTIWSKDDI